MSAWITSPGWDKESPEAEIHFAAFISEAKKDGLKLEFVIELIDLSIEENVTSQTKEKLKKIFRKKAQTVFEIRNK